MSSVDSQLRADLANALHHLEEAFDVLHARLCAASEYPTWVWKETDPLRGRREASRIIRAIDYDDAQDPHESRICPALLGAAPETLAAANAVNNWKLRVKQALAPMKGRMITEVDPRSKKPVKRPLEKVALKWLQHPRFHRRQASRQIVVCNEPIARASFFWAISSKNQKISRDDAIQMVEKRFEQGDLLWLRQAREALLALRANEPLAIMDQPHIHPKVNLVIESAHGVKRIPKRAVLPILYPANPNQAAPDLRPLPDEKPVESSRLQRSDVKVEREPFIPQLRIHRYLPHCRDAETMARAKKYRGVSVP